MFDRAKERIKKLEEDHESIRKAKAHVEKYQLVYAAAGSSALTLVAVRVFGGPQVIVKDSAGPVFNNTVAPVMQNVVNTIVLPAHGDPGDVVQNLRTLETYASKGEMARELGIARAIVSKYFSGELPDILGDQFKVIGKAGYPIPIA